MSIPLVQMLCKRQGKINLLLSKSGYLPNKTINKTIGFCLAAFLFYFLLLLSYLPVPTIARHREKDHILYIAK